MKYAKCMLIIALLCLVLAACDTECIHEYSSSITLAATCTQEGTETFTCTHCGDSYTEEIPVISHSFGESVVEVAVTCAQEGYTVATCQGCGQTKQTILPKLPHTLENATVTKLPTCTQQGECIGRCAVCHTEGVTEAIPTNTAHQFENTVIREATCTDPGEGLDTCTLCGHTQSCTYSLKAHDFSKSETLTAATCTASGTKKVTCSHCEASQERKVSALGHKWTGATCQKEGICSRCHTIGEKADHDYEILSETGTGKHFAKKVDKKCKTCGLQKKLYYAGEHEFDLEAIYKELEDYAKSYGFQVTNSFDGLPYYQQIQKVNATVYHSYQNIVGDSGPENLLRRGKAMIDKEYSFVKNSANKYQIHLSVTYGESASMGLGSFSLKVTHTGIE